MARGHLATLTAPKYVKGQSGNPAGRSPNSGSSYRELTNLYSTMETAAVQAIADSPRSSLGQIRAARSALRSVSTEYSRHMPHAANDLDRILDRTEGKPVARVIVQRSVAPDPVALLDELRAALADLPPSLRPLIADETDSTVTSDDN